VGGKWIIQREALDAWLQRFPQNQQEVRELVEAFMADLLAPAKQPGRRNQLIEEVGRRRKPS
jgi:hypothetical protein